MRNYGYFSKYLGTYRPWNYNNSYHFILLSNELFLHHKNLGSFKMGTSGWVEASFPLQQVELALDPNICIHQGVLYHTSHDTGKLRVFDGNLWVRDLSLDTLPDKTSSLYGFEKQNLLLEGILHVCAKPPTKISKSRNQQNIIVFNRSLCVFGSQCVQTFKFDQGVWEFTVFRKFPKCIIGCMLNE